MPARAYFKIHQNRQWGPWWGNGRSVLIGYICCLNNVRLCIWRAADFEMDDAYMCGGIGRSRPTTNTNKHMTISYNQQEHEHEQAVQLILAGQGPWSIRATATDRGHPMPVCWSSHNKVAQSLHRGVSRETSFRFVLPSLSHNIFRK